MDRAQAIQKFWESFGLDAYNELSVPDINPNTGEKLKPPYITYDLVIDSLGYEVAMSAMLHYKDTSWKDINDKVSQIEEYIGRGGVWITFDGGKGLIRRGRPFAQPRTDLNDSLIKQFLLNISCEYIKE